MSSTSPGSLPGLRPSPTLGTLRSSSKFGFPYPFIRDTERGSASTDNAKSPTSNPSSPPTLSSKRNTVGQWKAFGASLRPSSSSALGPSDGVSKQNNRKASRLQANSKSKLPARGKHLLAQSKVLSMHASGMAQVKGRFQSAESEHEIPASLIPAESLLVLNEGSTVIVPSMAARHGYNSSVNARMDLSVVERWMKHMLEEVRGSPVSTEEQFDDAMRIYHIAVHEICRQIMVETFHRGDFLLRTWADYTKLITRHHRHLVTRFAQLSQETASFKSAFCEMQLENCDLRRELESRSSKGGGGGGEKVQGSGGQRPSRLSAYGRATLKELRREGNAQSVKELERASLRRRSSVFSQKTLEQLDAEEEREGVDMPVKKALFQEFFKCLDEDLDGNSSDEGEQGDRKKGKKKQAMRLDEQEELRLRVQMLEQDLQNSLNRIQSDEAEIDRLEESIANLIHDGRHRENVLCEVQEELNQLKSDVTKVEKCVQTEKTMNELQHKDPSSHTPGSDETASSSSQSIGTASSNPTTTTPNRAGNNPESIRPPFDNVGIRTASEEASSSTSTSASTSEGKPKKGGKKRGAGRGKSYAKRGEKEREKAGALRGDTNPHLNASTPLEHCPLSAEVMRGKRGQVQEVSWVLKTVEGLYQVFLRSRLDERGSPNPVKQMLLEYYLKKHGLPSVATRHLDMLAANLFHYQTHASVSTFFRLFDAKIPPESLAFCLTVRRLCSSTSSPAELKLGVSASQDGKHSNARVMFPQDESGVDNWVCLVRAGLIAEYMLHGLNARNLDAVAKKLARYSQVGPCEVWATSMPAMKQLLDQTPRIHADVLVHILLEEDFIVQEKQARFFQQLFVEGDTNNDGVLSFSEFQDIVHTVTKDLSSDEIVSMFREAIMHPKNAAAGLEDAMTSQAFAQVCQDHNLQAYLQQIDDENGTFKPMSSDPPNADAS